MKNNIIKDFNSFKSTINEKSWFSNKNKEKNIDNSNEKDILEKEAIEKQDDLFRNMLNCIINDGIINALPEDRKMKLSNGMIVILREETNHWGTYDPMYVYIEYNDIKTSYYITLEQNKIILDKLNKFLKDTWGFDRILV